MRRGCFGLPSPRGWFAAYPLFSFADPDHQFIAMEDSVSASLIGCLIILAIVLVYIAFAYNQLKKLASGQAGTQVKTGVLAGIQQRITKSESRAAVLETQSAFQRNGFVSLLSLLEVLDTTSNVADVMNKAIEAVMALTGVRIVAIRLYDDEKSVSQLVAQSGMTPEMVAELEWIPADRGFPGEIIRTKNLICAADLETHPLIGGQSPIKAGIKSLASVPLIVGDDVIGSMELGMKTRHEWDLDQRRWLMLVGRSIALSVHQVRMNERLKQVAVLEERNRVAQEIHDGVAQLLGCIRLWAEEALLLAEKHKTKALNQKLTQIETISQEALSSLRDEMFALRSTPERDRDLLPVFANFLNRIQKQWGILVRLEVFRNQEGHPNAALTTAAETQLLRVVQEGLTNIRRHANAKNIVLRVEDNPKNYRVLIRDDGKGFDPRQVSPERLGLKIMQERAVSVGGRVWVTSETGVGTVVEIILPKQVVGARDSQVMEAQHDKEVERVRA